jgi:curved DNA-binding protein CbpA
MFHPHPYEILEIAPTANNNEVLKAFAKAMQRKKYAPDLLAKARKALMDPAERQVADYLWGSWHQPLTPTTPNPAVLNDLEIEMVNISRQIANPPNSTPEQTGQLTPTQMDQELAAIDRLLSQSIKNFSIN